jgi:GAF domain-containing protein
MSVNTDEYSVAHIAILKGNAILVRIALTQIRREDSLTFSIQALVFAGARIVVVTRSFQQLGIFTNSALGIALAICGT